MFERLIVAVDGSESSARALNLAVSLAKSHGATLVVCSAVDPAAATWKTAAGANAERALDRERQSIEAIAEEALAIAARKGVIARSEMPAGRAAGAIVECARRNRADAVVMGTHGWSGLRHALMGSVAESVLRAAPCPVIVVRDGAAIPDTAASAT
ncbi:MAG TPA: universal stress protein [Candidatus Acidoferrales bacterium]|nr:universal stress protein [Candidatus Acidoferrales bacterium]